MFSLPGKELEGRKYLERDRGRQRNLTHSEQEQKEQWEIDFYRGEETQIQQAHWEKDRVEELGETAQDLLEG